MPAGIQTTTLYFRESCPPLFMTQWSSSSFPWYNNRTRPGKRTERVHPVIQYRISVSGQDRSLAMLGRLDSRVTSAPHHHGVKNCSVSSGGSTGTALHKDSDRLVTLVQKTEDSSSEPPTLRSVRSYYLLLY